MNRIAFPRPRAELSAEQRQWIQWVDLDGHHYSVMRGQELELSFKRISKGQYQPMIKSKFFESRVSKLVYDQVAEEVDETTKTETL